MLDESMFEDIHEIAENSAYLKAVEEKDVCVEMFETLPAYECLHDWEEKLNSESKLNFDYIFGESIGFYMIKCFLKADYAVDKAIFLKDVEAYRSMRFESARRRVALLLYQRFVSTEETTNWEPGSSVFKILQMNKGAPIADIHAIQAHQAVHQTPTLANAQLNQPQITSQLQQYQIPSPGHSALPSNSATNNVVIPPTTQNGHSAGDHRHGSNSDSSSGSSSSPPVSQLTGHPLTLSIPIKESALAPLSPSSGTSTLLQMGTSNNSIGVYGKSVRIVKERVLRGEAPVDLFDEVERDVLMDLKLDVFPRFKQSEFYKRYIRAKWIENSKVTYKDFTTFRVLGRGGFGAVHACRKQNSGQIYAMKCVNKKLVKVKSALDNVLEERNVLTMMKSPFVTNLKYALQDDETLYLIMDLMLGGDLKFHLINAGRFTEKRARFYAAEVLLGLDHVHRMSIIYRDMKLENILLDHSGHVKLSDLGLAVVTKVKIKGYAGTPGYTAPEMIKNKLYGTAADIFSYGVMVYRMLCGSKPFKGKVDRDLDKAVVERKPPFPKEIFTKDAISLLSGLLLKRPDHRLGCGERGIQEIKEHLFFADIDWGLLEAGYLDPPFVPNKFDVNAASLRDIGDFDRAKYKNVKLEDRFKQRVKNFEYVSVRALHEEMVAVLEKVDENYNFEKFAPPPPPSSLPPRQNQTSCCIVL